MNPIVTLSHNNLPLTQRFVESAFNQDITVDVLIFDNGSTDGTREWLEQTTNHGGNRHSFVSKTNQGVSKGWNWALDYWFRFLNADHVLVCGNDTVLPVWFYRTLLDQPWPFITGIAVDNFAQLIEPPPGPIQETPYPDFSGFLIRRPTWEAIGPFDETMVNYCSDCDMHIRAHQKKWPMYKVAAPFYHERSSTMRLAAQDEQIQLNRQADLDRAAFRAKWNCLPGTKEYYQLFA